jgi:ribokinase
MAARIFVFGSYFADMVMATPRLPRRGETIAGGPFRTSHGGKGSNQAVAARRAGAEVVFATRLGDDDAGRAALRLHAEEGIDARHVAIDRDGVATGAALIMVEDGSAENMITLAMGACGHFTDAEVDAAVAGARGCTVALFQLETNLGATLRAIRAMRAAGARTILNPAPARELPGDIYPHVDVLTPNETEAAVLAGIDTSGEAGIRAAARILLDRGCGIVVVTMGANGVFALSRDGFEAVVPAAPGIRPVDTTGAGDSFAGCLACALGEGMDLPRALRFANAGAGLSTTRHGAAPSMARRAEIEALLARGG